MWIVTGDFGLTVVVDEDDDRRIGTMGCFLSSGSSDEMRRRFVCRATTSPASSGRFWYTGIQRTTFCWTSVWLLLLMPLLLLVRMPVVDGKEAGSRMADMEAMRLEESGLLCLKNQMVCV